jgi:uncharacterized OsmC-like protein
MSTTSVQAIYLEREYVRVEFAYSSIVSDHPVRVGGFGKGPSPGDIMFAGLTAASVFVALDQARRCGVRLNSVVARAGMQPVREGKEGPLHALGFLKRIWRRLEIDGALNTVAPAALGGPVGILETMRNGVPINETVNFANAGATRAGLYWKNAPFLDHEKVVDGIAPGARIDGPVGTRWAVSATALDDDTVMLDLPGVPLCVSRTAEARRGPTPVELVLGGLAACTAIYVGRNAPFHDIPLNRIAVTAAVDAPADLATPWIGPIAKVTDLVGDLTDAEKEKCKFFSDFCALGETLKRGAAMIDTVVTRDSGVAASARSPLVPLTQSPPPPSELACDDGACCVPAAQTAAA